jgi:Uma2 family endonuclease
MVSPELRPPHVIACEKTHNALQRVVGAGWRVMTEAPVRIPMHNEPEPDVALARGSPDDYADGHPGPADVALIVEVADSSPQEDRELVRVYGQGGIAVYWIVNLVDRQVEVYTGPRPGGYSQCAIFREGEAVPVVIDGAEVGQIAVDDMLPRRPTRRRRRGQGRQ